MEKYFIEIPVYRIPEKQYSVELENYINKHLNSGTPQDVAFMQKTLKESPNLKLKFKEILKDDYGGNWKYNEIIGYIRLFFLGTQIRGEYWGTKAKRKRRTRKKFFEYKTWKLAPEIELHWETESSAIFAKVLEYITACSKELKGRYIDVRPLMVIGPYVDWMTLYKEENGFKDTLE